MALRSRTIVHSACVAVLGVACGGKPVHTTATGGPDASPPDMPGAGGAPGALNVTVSATHTTYVKLDVPAVVEVSDPLHSTAWDLAFVGYDVFTNGGLSGPGQGAAFGPISVGFFAFPDQPVDVPILIQDYAGGAFLDWYAYEGPTHTLYSRYHVYGIESGGRHYKLQLLDYYDTKQGTTTSALYSLRYAEVPEKGSVHTVEIDDLDATLGGAAPGPDVPSTCLELATGATPQLSPNDAESSLAWDLCFRRDTIGVNGGVGGPGDASAVDLEAADTAGESLDDVKARSADNQQTLFDGIDFAALTAPDLVYRGDYVISAFTGTWANLSADPPVPVGQAAFLVVGADGSSRYLVAFNAFDGADATTPGTIELGIEPSVSP
jgi:hypothetical protein